MPGEEAKPAQPQQLLIFHVLYHSLGWTGYQTQQEQAATEEMLKRVLAPTSPLLDLCTCDSGKDRSLQIPHILDMNGFSLSSLVHTIEHYMTKQSRSAFHKASHS